MLYFFCLLCAYYVLRPVRDAMGAAANVADIFPQALIDWAAAREWDLGEFVLQILFTGTFVVMLLLQPIYGALVSRFPRRVFLPAVYLFFVACLLAFRWAFETQLSGRGALFFIWTAVFNLFAVSVFWSYMADVFDNASAKRVYGFIGAAGTLGALSGPALARSLVGPLGVGNLLLVSVGLLLVCFLCIVMLRPAALQREAAQGRESGKAMGGSVWAGLRLVAGNPLLCAMALLMFFGVGVGTLLYNEQAAIVRAMYPNTEDSTRFYSSIDWAINSVTLLVQLFVTGGLLRRYGLAPALLIPGFGILLGYCLLAMSPFPLLVAATQVVTRAGEFSLAKPARETIYTEVDRESRYKAKAFIDTAVYRGGDLTFVWLHKWLATFGSRMVFLAGIGITLGMILSALALLKQHRRVSQKAADADVV